MAEILIKVGDSLNRDVPWYDGDVIRATNNISIALQHAKLICLARNTVTRRFAALADNGLIPMADVLFDHEYYSHRICFQRLSKLEAVIIRLSDLAQIQIEDDKPFEDFQGIIRRWPFRVIITWLRRILEAENAQGIPVFGATNQEVFFLKRIPFTPAAITNLWEAILVKKGLSPSDPQFRDYPIGTETKKVHLALRMENFTDVQAATVTVPVVDGDGVMTQRRSYRVRWNRPAILSHLGVTADQVLNRTYSIDCRNVAPLPLSVVEAK